MPVMVVPCMELSNQPEDWIKVDVVGDSGKYLFEWTL